MARPSTGTILATTAVAVGTALIVYIIGSHLVTSSASDSTAPTTVPTTTIAPATTTSGPAPSATPTAQPVDTTTMYVNNRAGAQAYDDNRSTISNTTRALGLIPFATVVDVRCTADDYTENETVANAWYVLKMPYSPVWDGKFVRIADLKGSTPDGKPVGLDSRIPRCG